MPKKYLNTYKLMIGDWVCVYSNDRTETHPFRVNEIVERGVYDSHKGFVEEKDIEPIPLTPEVLKKNGFKLKEWGSHKQYQLTYSIECEDVVTIKIDYIGNNFVINLCRNDIVIYNVHELQHILNSFNLEINKI